MAPIHDLCRKVNYEWPAVKAAVPKARRTLALQTYCLVKNPRNIAHLTKDEAPFFKAHIQNALFNPAFMPPNWEDIEFLFHSFPVEDLLFPMLMRGRLRVSQLPASLLTTLSPSHIHKLVFNDPTLLPHFPEETLDRDACAIACLLFPKNFVHVPAAIKTLEFERLCFHWCTTTEYVLSNISMDHARQLLAESAPPIRIRASEIARVPSLWPMLSWEQQLSQWKPIAAMLSQNPSDKLHLNPLVVELLAEVKFTPETIKEECILNIHSGSEAIGKWPLSLFDSNLLFWRSNTPLHVLLNNLLKLPVIDRTVESWEHLNVQQRKELIMSLLQDEYVMNRLLSHPLSSMMNLSSLKDFFRNMGLVKNAVFFNIHVRKRLLDAMDEHATVCTWQKNPLWDIVVFFQKEADPELLMKKLYYRPQHLLCIDNCTVKMLMETKEKELKCILKRDHVVHKLLKAHPRLFLLYPASELSDIMIEALMWVSPEKRKQLPPEYRSPDIYFRAIAVKWSFYTHVPLDEPPFAEKQEDFFNAAVEAYARQKLLGVDEKKKNCKPWLYMAWQKEKEQYVAPSASFSDCDAVGKRPMTLRHLAYWKEHKDEALQLALPQARTWFQEYLNRYFQ